MRSCGVLPHALFLCADSSGDWAFIRGVLLVTLSPNSCGSVPAFISLDGVADVPPFGSRRPILRVELDPGRMSTYGLTVSDIRAVLPQAPLDVPAGSFKTSDQTLLVRADAAVDSEDDIGNLFVTDQVRLRDVARIAYTPDDATSVVRLNGQRVLGVGVVRQAGSNTIQISEGAHRAVARFNAQRPYCNNPIATAKLGSLT